MQKSKGKKTRDQIKKRTCLRSHRSTWTKTCSIDQKPVIIDLAKITNGWNHRVNLLNRCRRFWWTKEEVLMKLKPLSTKKIWLKACKAFQLMEPILRLKLLSKDNSLRLASKYHKRISKSMDLVTWIAGLKANSVTGEEVKCLKVMQHSVPSKAYRSVKWSSIEKVNKLFPMSSQSEVKLQLHNTVQRCNKMVLMRNKNRSENKLMMLSLLSGDLSMIELNTLAVCKIKQLHKQNH